MHALVRACMCRTVYVPLSNGLLATCIELVLVVLSKFLRPVMSSIVSGSLNLKSLTLITGRLLQSGTSDEMVYGRSGLLAVLDVPTEALRVLTDVDMAWKQRK